MLKIPTPQIIVLASLASFACTLPCYDNPSTQDQVCDAEQCPVGSVPSDTGDETGGADAVCTPYCEPHFGLVDRRMSCCGVVLSGGEHIYESKASAYGITDYSLDETDATFALIFDQFPVGDGSWSPTNPNNAVPGVVSYEQLGIEFTGYASRGCCPQRPVGEPAASFDWIPNDACQGGPGLRGTPNGWCLEFQRSSSNESVSGGLCVYPCGNDYDCADPALEFCDLSIPDPAGKAPGVCRYKSMSTVPTSLDAINDPAMPLISSWGEVTP